MQKSTEDKRELVLKNKELFKFLLLEKKNWIDSSFLFDSSTIECYFTNESADKFFVFFINRVYSSDTLQSEIKHSKPEYKVIYYLDLEKELTSIEWLGVLSNKKDCPIKLNKDDSLDNLYNNDYSGISANGYLKVFGKKPATKGIKMTGYKLGPGFYIPHQY